MTIDWNSFTPAASLIGGRIIAGMANPAKLLGFLDLAGMLVFEWLEYGKTASSCPVTNSGSRFG